MNLACKITGHKWNGCTCTRCGEHRDDGHRWSAGIGDGNKYDKYTCEICGSVKRLFHKFEKIDGCHLRCTVCGLERSTHSWRGCVCDKCGETREMSLYATVPLRSPTTGAVIGSKCPGPREAGHRGPWVSDPSNPCIIVCKACGKRAWDHELVLVGGQVGESAGGGSTIDFGSGYKCTRCGKTLGGRGNVYCDDE